MFGMTNRLHCQPSSTPSEKKPTHLGQSYDYFERHKALVLGDDLHLKQKQRKHTEWATGDDEVFCNVNALECDEQACLDRPRSEREAYQHTQVRKNPASSTSQQHEGATFLTNRSTPVRTSSLSRQPITHRREAIQTYCEVDNSTTSPNTYSRRAKSYYSSPESLEPLSKTAQSHFISGSPRQEVGSGTRQYQASPRADYHPSPTTPDEGYSTGTNSTTSISSPLSASLASVAFFDAGYPKGSSNTSVGQGAQRAVAVSPGSWGHNSINTQNSENLGSFPNETNTSLEPLSYSRENTLSRGFNANVNNPNSEQCMDYHSPQPIAMTQRGPIQKGPSLNHFGRKSFNTSSMPAIKRRDVPNPVQSDLLYGSTLENNHNAAYEGNANCPAHSMSSLEDRLRALTTIEEEDVGNVDRQGQINIMERNSHISLPEQKRSEYKTGTRENIHVVHKENSKPISGLLSSRPREDQTDEFAQNTQAVEATGFFRAEPVHIGQPKSYPYSGHNATRVGEDHYSEYRVSNRDPGTDLQHVQEHQQRVANFSLEGSRYDASEFRQNPPDHSHSQCPTHTIANEEIPTSSFVDSGAFSTNSPGWKDYQQYFQKDVNIPAHNIDPAVYKKFSTAERNAFQDMDTNTKLKQTKRDNGLEEGNLASSQNHGETNFCRINTSLQHASSLYDSNNRITDSSSRQSDRLAMVRPLQTKSMTTYEEASSLLPFSSAACASSQESPLIGNTGDTQNASQNQPYLQRPIDAHIDEANVPLADSAYLAKHEQSLNGGPEYYNVASSMPDLLMPQQNSSNSFYRPQEHPLNTAFVPHDRFQVHKPIHDHAPQSNIQGNHCNSSDTYPTSHHSQLEIQEQHRQPSLDYSFNQQPSSSFLCLNDSNYNGGYHHQSRQHHQFQHEYLPQQQRGYVHPPQGISELQHVSPFTSQPPMDPLHRQTNPASVTMRRPLVNASDRTQPNHTNRYSWQPHGPSEREGLGVPPTALQRSSVDLGNLPQLQNQIRASSELCLQASRRHMFASSADIYKLFSNHRHRPCSSLASPSSPSAQKDSFNTVSPVGQPITGGPNFLRGRNDHRHSFHSTNSSSMYTAIEGKHRQSFCSPTTHLKQQKNFPVNGETFPKINQTYQNSPIVKHFYSPDYSENIDPYKEQPSARFVHCSYVGDDNLNPPAENLPHLNTAETCQINQTNFVPAQTTSMPHIRVSQNDSYDLPTQNAQDPLTDKLTAEMFSELTKDLDFGLQAPPLQRQSSGYSSETELQQIEYNAKAVKRQLHHMRKQARENRVVQQPKNPAQEFIALNTSADHDSTTTAGTEDSTTEEFVPIAGVGNRRSFSAEPVYMNQIMLGPEISHPSHNKDDDVPPPLPARRPTSVVVSAPSLQHSRLGYNNSSLKDSNHSDHAPFFFEASSDKDDDDNNSCQVLSNSTNERLQQEFLSQRNHSPFEYHQHLLQHSTNSDIFHGGRYSSSTDTPVLTQHQVINFQKRPVTITSHIPQTSLTQDNHSFDSVFPAHSAQTQAQNSTFVNNDTKRDHINSNDYNWQGTTRAYTHLMPHHNADSNSIPRSPNESSTQILKSRIAQGFEQNFDEQTDTSSHLSLEVPMNRTNSLKLEKPASVNSLVPPGTDHRSSSTSSNSIPMSPVEIAQVLEIPFATNIISDEQGDRLSTLV
ncbi:hypothetical protein ElyMa_006876800 [Elysia marginata]|uniref:Uncharacterized protein n=1 Tax=Elysia marginata TaxID=1093978 RepID=A0AAV4J9W5_9GAST|nr:hypothetical protein ElyMa_006876800 [Elysia marginata]